MANSHDSTEPVAWAVYWGLPPTRKNSVHFDKESAQAVANQIKSATEVRPLYAAPVAQQPQAEAVPSSGLNPDEGDPVTLWAEIWRLREAVKGPDGYATWQDAATAERIRRVRAESKQAEASALIERMADALRSCSGVPHWPSFQPLINEASKWKVEAVPPTHVLVPVEPTVAMLQALSGEWHPSRHRPDLYRAMIDAAIAQQKGGV